MLAAGIVHGVEACDRTTDASHLELQKYTDRLGHASHDVVDQIVKSNGHALLHSGLNDSAAGAAGCLSRRKVPEHCCAANGYVFIMRRVWCGLPGVRYDADGCQTLQHSEMTRCAKRRPLHSRWQTLGLARQSRRAGALPESRCAKAIASGKMAAAVIAVAIMAACAPTASPNIPKRIGATAPAPIVPV
jgi:hypothetical protein